MKMPKMGGTEKFMFCFGFDFFSTKISKRCIQKSKRCFKKSKRCFKKSKRCFKKSKIRNSFQSYHSRVHVGQSKSCANVALLLTYATITRHHMIEMQKFGHTLLLLLFMKMQRH